MSRENDREVKLPSDGTESTEMDRSRHIPKMDVTNNSTFKELEQWRMMYENSFFNPLPTVQTERSVCDVLGYEQVNKNSSSFKGGTTVHCLKTKLRPRHHVRLHQNLHWTLSTFPESPKHAHPPEIKPSTHPIHISEITPITPKKQAEHDDIVTPESPKRPKLPGVSQLRRPVVSGQQVAPVVVTKLKSEHMDSWCPWNYITLPDDAPFTPQSFYAHNYPLLLQKIPKRAEVLEEQEQHDTWRPLTRTPEISLSCFDDLTSLSIGSLSSLSSLYSSLNSPLGSSRNSPLSYSTSEVSLNELLDLSRSSSEREDGGEEKGEEGDAEEKGGMGEEQTEEQEMEETDHGKDDNENCSERGKTDQESCSPPPPSAHKLSSPHVVNVVMVTQDDGQECDQE